MNKLTVFSISIALAMTGALQTASADDDSDWVDHQARQSGHQFAGHYRGYDHRPARRHHYRTGRYTYRLYRDHDRDRGYSHRTHWRARHHYRHEYRVHHYPYRDWRRLQYGYDYDYDDYGYGYGYGYASRYGATRYGWPGIFGFSFFSSD